MRQVGTLYRETPSYVRGVTGRDGSPLLIDRRHHMGTILLLVGVLALVPMIVSAGAAIDRHFGKKHTTTR